MNIINGRRIEISGDGDITGDVGVVITGSTGPLHLGEGDVIVGVVGDVVIRSKTEKRGE